MNNKVYINPKFNKMSSNNVLPGNNKMHLNPNFTQNMMHNNSRIYVNPNFIRLNAIGASQNETCYGLDQEIPKIEYPLSASKNGDNLSVNLAAKSRYSLVRNTTSTQALPKQADSSSAACVQSIGSRTIKINKYKSVAISDFKKKLDIKETMQRTKQLASVGSQPLFLQRDDIVFSPKPKQTHKYLGGSSCSASNVKSRFRLRNTPLEPIRKVSLVRTPFKSRVKRHMKKNNIPCPLFKKYGKCLRSIHGTCDFLHDKKHVSICRKFMKGICHDKDCLLSHEITSKKMPTCYFYLKGMCAKENCPYIHVKLNEKTKVCLEFLKGYCEKGEKCLNRHISYQSADKIKLSKQILSFSKNKKSNNKIIVNKCSDIIVTKDFTKIARISPGKDETTDKSCHSDNRYYEDQHTTTNNSQSSEVIKPTRCKLGTLPSFIKL